MNIETRIALRYLLAGRKSGSVAGRISAVSVAGMAIGTAALIVILSVYNGFDSLVLESQEQTTPDYVVRPAKGQTFTAFVPEDPAILQAEPVLTENVYVRSGRKSTVARATGYDGASGVSVSSALRSEVGSGPLELFYPDRTRPFSVSSPSLRTLSVNPGSVFGSEELALTLDADSLRSLLALDPGAVSEIRIYASEKPSLNLPEGLELLDRAAQNPALYRMLRIEKLIIEMILLFVVVIVAFNVSACLSILQLEKTEGSATLVALGMTGRQVRRVFVKTGFMICLLGLAAGLVLGVGLVLLQDACGLVRMPGLMGTPYPVRLMLSDVALTVLGVTAVGGAVSLSSARLI